MPIPIGTCFRFYTQMLYLQALALDFIRKSGWKKKTKHLHIKSIVTSHNSVPPKDIYFSCPASKLLVLCQFLNVRHLSGSIQQVAKCSQYFTFLLCKGQKKSSPSYDLLSSHTRFASLFYLYSIVVLCWVGPFFCLFCKIAGWIFYVVFHSKFAVYTRISEIMSCEEPVIFCKSCIYGP